MSESSKVAGTPPPSPHVRGYEAFRDTVLEEAARAAETAQIPGSLMRPGIAKVIRAMKTPNAPDAIVTPMEQAWRDGFMEGEQHAAEAPSPVHMRGPAREIIARFLAEKAAFSPMSGGITTDMYMSFGGMHEQADELLKRLGSQWLGINTAPKDGSRILGWCEEWSAPQSVQYYGPNIGWCQNYDNGPFKYQPTNWMPLPEPPAPLNELTIYTGGKPSDSEIDFEATAWNTIKRALATTEGSDNG